MGRTSLYQIWVIRIGTNESGSMARLALRPHHADAKQWTGQYGEWEV